MTNYSAKHWAIKAEKSAKDAESYASGIDLSSYVNKSELESSLEGYAPKNSLNTKADVDLGNTELADLKNENGTLTWNGEAILKSGDIDTSSYANTSASNFNATGKSNVASWCMPSDEYIDLTLGVNLSKYTAPANGYLTLSRVTGNGNQFVCLRNVNNGMRIYSGMVSNNAVRVFMPVKKGHVVEIEYNATGAIEYYRFIYAEGEI